MTRAAASISSVSTTGAVRGGAAADNRGLYRHRDGHIYVSRGCGFWGPPARVGSAPEIAKIVLTG